MYKHSNTIKCPYCHKEQFDSLDDLIDGEDMVGSFEEECEKCYETFMVHFEYRPYNFTQKKDTSRPKSVAFDTKVK